jgi:hypothetical protein
MREARKFKTIDQAIAAMGKPLLVHKASESLTQYSWYHTVTVVEKDGEKRDYSDGVALYADADGKVTFRLLIHYPNPIMMDEGLKCFLPVIAPSDPLKDQKPEPNKSLQGTPGNGPSSSTEPEPHRS